MKPRLFTTLLSLFLTLNSAHVFAALLAKCIGQHLHEETAVEDPAEAGQILEGVATIADDIKKNIENCETTECVNDSLSPVRERVKKILGKTCIGRNPPALQAMMIRLTINELGWATTWFIPAIKNHDYSLRSFPFEYAVANLILLPIMTAQACKNIFESGKPGEPPIGWSEMDWKYIRRAMASNVRVLVTASAGVGAANFAIDRKFRPDKKKEPVSHYIAKSTLLAVEQTTFGNASSVLFTDPFLKTQLPKLAELAAESSLKNFMNPKYAVTAVGLTGTYAAKTADFAMLNKFMNLTQIPFEKLMSMSLDEIEKAFTQEADCRPNDQPCIDLRRSQDK